MSTIFIAVQCCQCSTMQVKQKKKSSNKWNCVVCNQKQSVLKVFAQGFMAKDVRKFVQSFNMSRQLAEQESIDQQTLVPPSVQEIENLSQIDQKKKRTDWREYIDPEKDEKEEETGEVFDPKIVTELPKPLFKKPKLRNYSPGLDTDEAEGERTFRPVFAKRNATKQSNSLDMEPSKCGVTMGKGASKWSDYSTQADDIFSDKESMRCQPSAAMGASKWRDYITQDDDDDDDDNFAGKAPWKQRATAVKGASKWNDYITEEDDIQPKSGRDIAEHMGQWNRAEIETTLNDQRVEDDVHPDFQ